MLSFLIQYKSLILQLILSFSLTLILTFLKLPVLLLQGLYTYIHPDNLDSGSSEHGIKARIRRPSSSDSGFDSKVSTELRRKNKTKEKFEFDESKAQIFRLRLGDSQLETRVYFKEYYDAFNYSVVAISCMLLHAFLDKSAKSGPMISETLIPASLGVVGVLKVVIVLAKSSFERSASKRSEKQLSVLMGVLGFMLGLMIFLPIIDSIVEFDLKNLDGFGKFYTAVILGCLSGFLFVPAIKNARSFWLGTDQLRCNLSIISCGQVSRWLLYVNYLLVMFTSLLWVKPFEEILIDTNVNVRRGAHSFGKIGNTESLVGNLGTARSDFIRFRIMCLLILGILQIVNLRATLQMYLNEAVLCWYQRLHASKLPDLDFSRAKVFLHNHYLCLVGMQFFAPPALVLLFLGLSQIDGNVYGHIPVVCNLLPCSAFSKEVALFMAWWVVFVWAIFTSASLVMYRRGVLYVS